MTDYPPIPTTKLIYYRAVGNFMKRRACLCLIATSATAGCSSQPSSDNSSQTSSEETGVVIQDSSLLSHWERFGDISSNQVDAVGVGGVAKIGVQYSMPVHEGEVEELFQVTVYNDGSSVDSATNEDTRLVTDDVEKDEYERWEGFDTSNWDQGEYTAEVVVRDVVAEQNASVEFDFELNNPLGPDEVELVEVTEPSEWEVGQSESFSVTLRNTSDRDGSVVSPILVTIGDIGSQQTENPFRLNIPANSDRTWESSEGSFSEPATIEYTLNNVDLSWSIEIEE